jgi:hypothetical protein
MVCFRRTIVNTLHKGDVQDDDYENDDDDDDDDDDDNNNNNKEPLITSSEVLVMKYFRVAIFSPPFQSGFCAVRTLAYQHTAQCMLQTCIIKGNMHINYQNRTTQLLSSVCFGFFPSCLRLYSYPTFLPPFPPLTIHSHII